MNATLISPLAALPTALTSGLLLALAIVRLGRGKFPAALFGAAFSVGVVMGTLVLLAEAPFDLKANPHHFSTVVRAFGFAGFPEEAAKFAGVYLFVRSHWLRGGARDLLLGATAAALGFALFEDVLYIAAAGPKWGTVAATRAVTAIPMHVFLGMFAGMALARAEQSRTRLAAVLRLAAAWIAASLLHGFYDLALMIVDARPPYPQYVQASARLLDVSELALLHAVIVCPACGAVALALGSVRAIGRPPLAAGEAEPPLVQPNWLLRLLLAPATGWIVGGLLLAVATLFLATAAVLSFVVDLADPILLVAVPAVFLLATGLLLTRRAAPRSAWARGRPTLRRLKWAAAACAAALVVFAGYRWGEKPTRALVAFRITVGGAQLAVKGDYEDAIRAYGRALAVDPDLVDAMVNRAKANDILHRYDRALADLDRAVALQPNKAALFVQRGLLHEEIHDSSGAVADLNRALALSPDNPQILVERAGVYSDVGDDARAAAELARALALAPNSPDVLNAQANAFIKSGDFDRARKNLEEVVTLSPGAVDAYFTLGRLALYRGDFAGAIVDLQRASAASATPYPPMWLFLARARDGLDGAAQLAAQTRAWPSASWPYPVIHQMLGKMSPADARAAAANDDERCESDFYTAELALAHGDSGLARTAFQKALDECPSGFVEREGADAEAKRLDLESATKAPEPQAAGGAPAALPPPPAALPAPSAPAPQARPTEAENGIPQAAPSPPSQEDASSLAAVVRLVNETMANGGTLLLAHYASVNRDCSSRGPVVVRVLDGPASGEIQVEQGLGYSHFTGDYQRCGVDKVFGADVTYAPRKTFVGSDSVKLDVKFPSGLERIETFAITVK